MTSIYSWTIFNGPSEVYASLDNKNLPLYNRTTDNSILVSLNCFSIISTTYLQLVVSCPLLRGKIKMENPNNQNEIVVPTVNYAEGVIKCPTCSYVMGHTHSRLSGSRRSVITRNVNYGSRYHGDRRPLPHLGSYFKCLNNGCKTKIVVGLLPEYSK